MEWLDRLVGDDPETRRKIAEEELNLEIGQIVYDARTRAGLTQAKLAKLVGTTQSVVSRIEDADYYGHSIQLLRRVAAALDQRLDVRFLPRTRVKRRASP